MSLYSQLQRRYTTLLVIIMVGLAANAVVGPILGAPLIVSGILAWIGLAIVDIARLPSGRRQLEVGYLFAAVGVGLVGFGLIQLPRGLVSFGVVFAFDRGDSRSGRIRREVSR